MQVRGGTSGCRIALHFSGNRLFTGDFLGVKQVAWHRLNVCKFWAKFSVAYLHSWTLSPFLIILLSTNICTQITLEHWFPLKTSVITGESLYICINSEPSFVAYWRLSSWKVVLKGRVFFLFCLIAVAVFCFTYVQVVLYSLTVQWEQSVYELMLSAIICCHSLVFSDVPQCVSQNRMRILWRAWDLRRSPHVTKAEAVENAAILNSERENPAAQVKKSSLESTEQFLT